jgi:hypothetical protein
MSREIPLEIAHLRDQLRQDFTDKLPEATFGSGEEKERNFLSRALATLAIQRLSGCSANEAAAIVFMDETGFSFRATSATTWAPMGQTPVLRRVSKRRAL